MIINIAGAMHLWAGTRQGQLPAAQSSRFSRWTYAPIFVWL